MNCTVIVPAAGAGKRYGNKTPKQYIDIRSIPVIIRTLLIFDEVDEIDNVVLVIDLEWQDFVNDEITKHKVKKIPVIIQGGEERQDSVYNAVELKEVREADIILVHDSVRPLASTGLFKQIIITAAQYGSAIPGLPPKETVKQVNEEGFVEKTIFRDLLRSIQTPQGFQRDVFIKAYKPAKENNLKVTDDASLVERAGYKVKVIDGEEANIKITTPADMLFAENIIQFGS